MADQEKIHEKGFDFGIHNYNKIKVGKKKLEDATLSMSSALRTNQKNYANKAFVLRALAENDLPTLREISNFFYNTNGIYKRVCDYAINLYRYDWYLEPTVFDESVPRKTVLSDFSKIMDYADESHIKRQCGLMAHSIVVNGAYYGYVLPDVNNKIVIQELPVDYCRSRYYVNGDTPAIEFNMRFFDEKFTDLSYRLRVLDLFPKDFKKGYDLYRKRKLKPDYIGDTYGCWYLLEPGSAIKFSFGPNDMPLFVNSVPQILDLDAAQELDRRKQMQKLLKVLIQELPLDKNGDLIFDLDEARDIHNNAVEMLSQAIGVDVLTTFADVSVEDMSDSTTTTSSDDLEKVERSVYNSLGISKDIFNTDGNLSLEKSILNDESTLRPMLLQLEIFFDSLIQKKNPHRKKYTFRFHFLETTQYNYKDVAKLYKDQVQLGYSKMLPQVALGHSESSILNMAYFENEVLSLSDLMVPPLQSSTMNAEALTSLSGRRSSKSSDSDSTGGRPEKPDDQKSEKTIQNKESMS